jgi:hypothetical protein
MDTREIIDQNTNLAEVLKDLFDASRFLMYAVTDQRDMKAEWLDRAKRYISHSVDSLTGIAMRIG